MKERAALSLEWWDDLDKYWKWVAKDSSGIWRVFARKPRISDYCWAMEGKSKWGRFANAHHVYPPSSDELYHLDVDWRDSLYRRPKKKKKALCQFSATLSGLVNEQAFSQAGCYCQLEEGHQGDHHVLVRNSFGVNCVVAMPNDEPERTFVWRNLATAESVPKPEEPEQAGELKRAGFPSEDVAAAIRLRYRSLRRQGLSPYEATNRIFEMAEFHTKQAESDIIARQGNGGRVDDVSAT